MSIWIWAEVAALALALITLPTVLLDRQGRPLSAALWTLVLLLLPLVGVGAWWLFGQKFTAKRRRNRKRQARLDVLTSLARLRGRSSALILAPVEGSARDQARARLFSDSERVFDDHGESHVTVFEDARTYYDALEAAIGGATHHVHFQFYIFQPDAQGARFRDALVERARAGVKVRVLLDAVGSGAATGRFLKPLRDAGAIVRVFWPVRFRLRGVPLNFRNHRKLVVVDGRVAFLGGMNIGEEYLAWRDLGLRFTGPAVEQCQFVFAEDWRAVDDHDLAREPYFKARTTDDAALTAAALSPAGVRMRILASGPDRAVNAHFQAFFLACTTATSRIYITTPYFIPDQAMLAALTSAADRGVDVRLLLPGLSDVRLVQAASRSYYEGLLARGARIFEYQPSVLHKKAMLIDHTWCLVGSANIDVRSFQLNFELSAFVESEGLNASLAAGFAVDTAPEAAKEVTLRTVSEWSKPQKVLQAAAHLLSPLL